MTGREAKEKAEQNQVLLEIWLIDWLIINRMDQFGSAESADQTEQSTLGNATAWCFLETITDQWASLQADQLCAACQIEFPICQSPQLCEAREEEPGTSCH